MSRIDRAPLHASFLAALTAAGAACSTTEAPETPETPQTAPINPLTLRASPPAQKLSDAALAEEMKKEGATFSGVDLRTPGVFPVFVVNIAQAGYSNRLLCDTEPCAPETLGLETKDVYDRALVVRDGAKTRVVFASNFTETFGTIDTKEEAAARAAVVPSQMAPAQCADLEAFGASCAPGSTPTGIAVRASEGGGFDVVLFGSTNVCENYQHGHGHALEVFHVTPTGEVQGGDSALGRGSRAMTLASGGVQCQTPMLGRMFEGYVDLPVGVDLREHLARAARQEAAAIHAFARLAEELARFGAPAELVAAARSGAADETRHARLFAEAIAQLDAATGSTMPLDLATPPEAWRERTLFEVLLENAIEGCANETYAALVATHQAEAPCGAPAPLRPFFAEIAEDERAHAALAFEIHRWGRALLTLRDQRTLDAALSGAIARMKQAQPSEIGFALGEPSPSVAARAFERVIASL